MASECTRMSRRRPSSEACLRESSLMPTLGGAPRTTQVGGSTAPEVAGSAPSASADAIEHVSAVNRRILPPTGDKDTHVSLDVKWEVRGGRGQGAGGRAQ